MIFGSRLIRAIISAEGFALLFLTAAVWLALRPKQRLARLWLAVLVVAFATLGSLAFAEQGAAWLGRPFKPLSASDVPSGRTAIVMLGSGAVALIDWNGTRFLVPDFAGSERAMEAARVFRLLNAQWVISSGGEPDPNDPNAPAGPTGRDALIRIGVPADRIVVEDRARTTREEAMNVSRILQSLEVERIVLVTSSTHMRRSIGVFRGLGIEPIPAVARKTSHAANTIWRYLPTARGLAMSETVLHEMLGLVYYRLRGWQG